MRIRRIGSGPWIGAIDPPPESTVSFTLTPRPDDTRTPEQWARVMLAECPAAIRSVLRFGWRYGLRLRLHPELPGTVLGWRVATSTDRLVDLVATSPLIDAHNLFALDGGQLVYTTAVHYRTPLGKLLWTVALSLHVLSVPYLLGRAARR